MELKNFIGVYNGVFTPEFCQSAIAYYENCAEAGLTFTRKQTDPNALKTQKNDTSVFMHDENCISLASTKVIAKQFTDAFNNILYPKYIEEYDALRSCGPMAVRNIKVQKTKVGEGYHIWHHETDSKASSHLVLAWIVYLNDVTDGGETEFLYQHTRVKPTQGTFVIWPAAFTHTHRGNPPLTGDKYIMTGWLEY